MHKWQRQDNSARITVYMVIYPEITAAAVIRHHKIIINS